jgi:hypothetical protein
MFTEVRDRIHRLPLSELPEREQLTIGERLRWVRMRQDQTTPLAGRSIRRSRGAVRPGSVAWACYWGGLAWREISVATISVMRSVPGGRETSWSRRVMRTWRAMELDGGSGVCLRWSL